MAASFEGVGAATPVYNFDSIGSSLEFHFSEDEQSPFSSCLDAIAPCEGKDGPTYQLCLVSNEAEHVKTIQKLNTLPVTGRVCIGVSCFFTLDAVAAKASLLKKKGGTIDHILIIDCSLKVEHFWQKMQQIVLESGDRHVALQAVKDLLMKEKERYYGNILKRNPERTAKRFLQILKQEVREDQISWLSTDRRFKKIKAIFEGGRFLFKRANLKDTEAMKAIAEVLKERELKVDMLYLSNVFHWLSGPEERERFHHNVSLLMEPETTVIDARRVHHLSTKPGTQRLMNGIDYISENRIS